MFFPHSEALSRDAPSWREPLAPPPPLLLLSPIILNQSSVQDMDREFASVHDVCRAINSSAAQRAADAALLHQQKQSVLMTLKQQQPASPGLLPSGKQVPPCISIRYHQIHILNK